MTNTYIWPMENHVFNSVSTTTDHTICSDTFSNTITPFYSQKEPDINEKLDLITKKFGLVYRNVRLCARYAELQQLYDEYLEAINTENEQQCKQDYIDMEQAYQVYANIEDGY